MKKLLCFIFCILCLTGCGEKKLDCSIVEKNSNYSIVETIVFKFDENEIKKGTYSLKLDVVDDYKDYLNDFKSSIILEYTNLYNMGVKRKISSKNNTLNFVLKYDATNYDKNQKQILLNHSLYMIGNYDLVKIELEKDGYVCE